MHFCTSACVSASQKKGGKLDEKKKAIFFEKLGVDHPLKDPAIKRAVLDKSQQSQIKKRTTTQMLYGVDHTWQSQIIKDKRRATCIAKFGVEHPLQNKDVWTKRWATQKLTGKFNCSFVEDECYVVLLALFGEVRRHVIVNNWEIDFYVPSIDTYVQFDGVYWHGLDRPIEEIEKLKNKRDVVILRTVRSDVDQARWFSTHDKRLVRITDLAFRNALRKIV